MNGWPYALALAVAAALAWDGWRRHLAITTRQLAVVHEFQAMKRDFELLTAQTKKAVEVVAGKLNDSIVEMQTKIEAQELKRGMNAPPRRFG